ncbi:alpha/beta fold hydrolase [Streptomyces griseus]|uniref:lipase family alpha/beta hydrolase n=1 Tax=Streptomyces griseus TaxID=1911 RepID=UPI003862FD11|nr:alpha/beta fold hydrolase [Streptomyces griseus]WTD69781.1 alpha/beta fold hydrolase [Streptomyces griseus]
MKLLPLPLPPLLSRLPRLPRPPRPPRLSSALLGATVLELAVLAGHLAVYPFGLTPERRPPTRPAGTEPGSGGGTALPVTAVAAPPPVVLLHGFVDNRSVFLLLRRALIRNGHDHGHHRHLESLNYSPLTRDIRAAAGLLGRHVEEICARTGHHRVDIVGHSLGGLIARYYVQRLGGDRRVRTLVTLGTPHGGTAVAPGAGVHPIVRQMRAGSSVIEELRTPAPGCRTRFVSFWSELDQVMVPVETACVDHPDLDAVNVRVTGIGHLALPVHPTVAAAIREALDAPVTGEDTAPADGAASVA